jgi:hypothetical protein
MRKEQTMNPEASCSFELVRNPMGRLVCTLADGCSHVGVTPVRAFPIGAPDEGLSLVGLDGRELVWVPRLSGLPAAQRMLIEDELASRELVPHILRIVGVSTFGTPSTWRVETDRGPAQLVLRAEEDIRRLPGARAGLLITGGHGIVFKVPDLRALDRHSRRLIERFL